MPSSPRRPNIPNLSGTFRTQVASFVDAVLPPKELTQYHEERKVAIAAINSVLTGAPIGIHSHSHLLKFTFKQERLERYIVHALNNKYTGGPETFVEQLIEDMQQQNILPANHPLRIPTTILKPLVDFCANILDMILLYTGERSAVTTKFGPITMVKQPIPDGIIQFRHTDGTLLVFQGHRTNHDTKSKVQFNLVKFKGTVDAVRSLMEDVKRITAQIIPPPTHSTASTGLHSCSRPTLLKR